MLIITSMLGWFGTAAAGEPACAEPVELDAWKAPLAHAESAFSALDQATFDQQMDIAARELPCLNAPVDSVLAARYHRLVGLQEFVKRDEEAARLAFAAARAVDPLGALPPDLLPTGHVARALAESASTPGLKVPLWQPGDTHLWFDGIPSTERPADRDTLLQVQVSDAVTMSRYLRPEDPLPRGVHTRAAHRAVFWVAGGAALGAAAVGAVLALP